LCTHLLRQLSGGREIAIEPRELAELASYSWPGNVRELKNVLERAWLLNKSGDFRPSQFLGKTAEPDRQAPLTPSGAADVLSLETVEARHIASVIRHFEGNHTRAAEALGISRSTLMRKLKLLSQ
jgi:DNA-binding NtrC family response regulator